jgi:hypothetical protein
MVFGVDGKARSGLCIRRFAEARLWNHVLDEAERHPDLSRASAFHVNRALVHTGGLSESMFQYSQSWGVDGLIPLKEQALPVAMDYSDFWFELGHVNEAEHWAHEALTQRGPTPRTARRIAEVNLIKRNVPMAESAIALLSRMPMERGHAKKFRGMLDDPPRLMNDPFLSRAVAMRPSRDFFVRLHLPEADVLSLLEQNPRNHQAFETLMAYTLLTRQLFLFAKYFDRINAFSYDRIPTHWEEALILYLLGIERKEPVFAGRAIRPATVERFNDVQEILNKHSGDRLAAKDELAKAYSGTYWYYVMYTPPNARLDQAPDGSTGATP